MARRIERERGNGRGRKNKAQTRRREKTRNQKVHTHTQKKKKRNCNNQIRAAVRGVDEQSCRRNARKRDKSPGKAKSKKKNGRKPKECKGSGLWVVCGCFVLQCIGPVLMPLRDRKKEQTGGKEGRRKAADEAMINKASQTHTHASFELTEEKHKSELQTYRPVFESRRCSNVVLQAKNEGLWGQGPKKKSKRCLGSWLSCVL